MQIAVLPLNAGPETRPALARQIANFACEIARGVTQKEVHAVNYLAQYPDEGVTRVAMVNPSEGLNEAEMIGQFWQQAPMERLVDGLFVERPDGGGQLTVRVFEKGDTEPADVREYTFLPGGIFGAARGMIETVVKNLEGALPGEFEEDIQLFGTSDPEAFTEFLLGFDAVQYIEKANGMVAREFQPEHAYDSLTKALDRDVDWEAPYLALLNLARLCTQFRIGSGDDAEKALKRVTEIEPDDPRGWYGLGQFYAAVGNMTAANDTMEKAVVKLQQKAARLRKEAEAAKAIGDEAAAQQLLADADATERDQAPVLAQLGLAQMNSGMPANAERSLRRAVELEPDEKPTLPLLSQLLTQTGRAHEVPAMWKELVEKTPQNAVAHVNYAQALAANQKQDEAIAVLDHALQTLEDTTFVKRFYAPILAQRGENDRAMDFYEEVLDVEPTNIPILLEYAQTLQNGNRAIDVPPVLKNVLAANPDPNTKAQTQAWLIELEQEKRVEAVKTASEKLEANDVEGALRELKPLRTWLADYWKMWAILAAALNRNEEYIEAENAAKQLLEIFPGCEPGYGELANALSSQGRDEEAYQMLRIGLMNVPGSVPIGINLGLAAKRTGRSDEARALAKQLREALRDHKELHPLLEEMES